MSMNGYYGELDESADELADETDEAFDGEFDEAVSRRPRRFNAGPTGRGAGYYTPRQSPTVSQPQFRSALSKVGSDVRKTSAAVERLTRQANSVTGQLLQKDTRQSKDIARLKVDAKSQAILTALALLLQRPGRLIDTSTNLPPVTGADAGNLAVTPPDNTLPVIAAAWMASSSSGASGFDINSLLSNPMLLLAGYIVLRDMQGNPLLP
jgi:hypothetical protein